MYVFPWYLLMSPMKPLYVLLLSQGLEASPRIIIKEREDPYQLSSDGRYMLDLKETLLEHFLFSVFFNDATEGILWRKEMTFADDTAKTTGTQIRKTYISLKSFHLKADNRIRFISETCRLIVTIRLGKKIIYNADT